MRRIARFVAALIATVLISAAAQAQEAPALARASGADKARLQELIATAVQEGQVAYIDTVIQPATNDALSDAFRKYYGLPGSFKVSYTTMTPGNVITRIEQEMRANRITVDVGAVASPPWAFARVKEGRIMAYDSPEYPAYAASFAMGLGKPRYFAFNGAYYFVPMWNAETMKFAGTSWKDVRGVVPPGRISTTDPSVSDSALMTYIGMRTIFDLPFFEEIAQLKPVFMYKSETIAGRLISGEDLFAMYGMPTRAYQFNQKGAKLQFMTPREGVVLLPQVMFILQDCPHPAAARLWLDFVLSGDGQRILALREALISGRSDFVSPLPDVVPAIGEVRAIKVDWDLITPESMEKARQEWAAIFKR
jgi:iron(III) transport system substrate-binding protein